MGGYGTALFRSRTSGYLPPRSKKRSRAEIFERPVNERAARYFNYTNIFEGVAEETPGGTRIDLGHFGVQVRAKVAEGSRAEVCIRQQDIRIIKEGAAVKESLRRNVLAGEITGRVSSATSAGAESTA